MRRDYVDALDAMADVSVNKYEADLFMTAGRAAEVTRRVARALRARIKAGNVSRWKLVSDGLYREQVLDRLVGDAVRRLYTEVQSRPDIANPRPSQALVRELARAYRKRTRSLMSIVRIASKGLGLLFEDDPMGRRSRPIQRVEPPRVRAQRVHDRVMELARLYLVSGGPIRDPQGTIGREIKALEDEMGKIPGAGRLSPEDLERIGDTLDELKRRAGIE